MDAMVGDEFCGRTLQIGQGGLFTLSSGTR
jgi:hypothetical protein